MAWYGKEGCKHEWRYRKDGWEEGCVPAICVKCGAFGCLCDVDKDCGGYQNRTPSEVFFGEGQNSDANINGRWVNPYVKGVE